jgi:16S rRNA (cytosine967-C5)-methyltransferase
MAVTSQNKNIRAVILDTLLWSETYQNRQDAPSEIADERIDNQSSRNRGNTQSLIGLEPRDKAFYKRVTEGTIERQIELDYILDQYSKIPVHKMKPLIRCLLRMSLYQILYMDQVPDAAACNEAVLLAVKRGFAPLKGFVNAVLRQIIRNKEHLPYPNEDEDFWEAAHIRYSMPKWILALWRDAYGQTATQKILDSLMTIHPVNIRFADRLKLSEIKTYLEQFTQQGVSWQPSPYINTSYRLTHIDGVDTLPGFQEGAFWVQDDSSALSILCADIHPGSLVIDACAAPGGKSILAAQRGAKVLAGDISPHKLTLIEENINRIDPTGTYLDITTKQWDAAEYNPTHEETADVLILDLPCSGLGVIGKKRDIKYRITPSATTEIITLQRQIIKNCWRYVKPGGILLYSTCTLNPDENENQVRYILDNLPFTPVSILPHLPPSVLTQKPQIDQTCPPINAQATTSPHPFGEAQSTNIQDAILRCLPGYLDTDGFFFAKLRRL